MAPAVRESGDSDPAAGVDSESGDRAAASSPIARRTRRQGPRLSGWSVVRHSRARAGPGRRLRPFRPSLYSRTRRKIINRFFIAMAPPDQPKDTTSLMIFDGSPGPKAHSEFLSGTVTTRREVEPRSDLVRPVPRRVTQAGTWRRRPGLRPGGPLALRLALWPGRLSILINKSPVHVLRHIGDMI